MKNYVWAIVTNGDELVKGEWFRNKEQALVWFEQVLSRKPMNTGIYTLKIFKDKETGKPFYQEERF